MPKNITVIQIFVAAPNDVDQERRELEDVVNELNNLWEPSYSIRLELWQWTTHAYPNFGIDPQDVINAQGPKDYDIFIGILWARFGTSTPSGRLGNRGRV